MKKILSLAVAFGLLMYSCTVELDKRIQRVNYGTSFGECVGFCRKQLSATADSIHFTAFCDACMSPITVRKDSFCTINKAQWDSLRSRIPVNAFNALPEVIGCPDCADGGAEWLELILTTGETHKVMFEYHNEPAELTQYLPILRRILSSYQLK